MVWLYNTFSKGIYVIYVNNYEVLLFCMQPNSVTKNLEYLVCVKPSKFIKQKSLNYVRPFTNKNNVNYF